MYKIKKSLLLLALLLCMIRCKEKECEAFPNKNYILLEKFHIHKGIEKLQAQKIFDNKFNILLNIVGSTDSTVFKYDSIKGYSVSFEYLKNNLNNKNKYALSYIDTTHTLDLINNAIYSKKNKLFYDTFNVFNYNLDRIYYDYRNIAKIDSIKSDSGFIYKYNYNINKVILISIAPFINVFDYLTGEKTDSVNFYCNNKRLIKEEYFFKSQYVIKNNYYYKSRLVKTIMYSIKSNGEREKEFIDIFKYTTLDNYKGFEFKEPSHDEVAKLYHK